MPEPADLGRSLREIRLDYHSFDEAYEPAQRKLVKALSEVVLNTRTANCDVETFLHSRTEEERRDIRRALKSLHKEEDLPRRPKRDKRPGVARSASTPAMPTGENGPELLPYAQMLQAKYDRHMFESTTYRDIGDWYLDHETGRDQFDLSGIQPTKRSVMTRLAGSDERKARDAFTTLQNAARGLRFLEHKSGESKRTDYREGAGAMKKTEAHKAHKNLPYPAASKVPGLEPRIWARTREELCGPPRAERSADDLAEDLRRRRREQDAGEGPKVPARAKGPPGADGAESKRALQHMNNVAKLGGFAKSTYTDQTNVVPLQVNSMINNERGRQLRDDARKPFLHGRRKTTIQDVSIVQASLPPIAQARPPL